MSGSKLSVHEFKGQAMSNEARMPEPLVMTIHSMPVPSPEAAQRVRAGRIRMLLVLLICAAPVIASYFTYYVIRPQARSNYGELIQPQRPLPALKLTDLQGRAVDPRALTGQWLFVAVAGGSCDAMCERNLYLQRQLRETLGKDRDRMDKVWFVTDETAIRPEVQKGIEGAQVLRVSRDELARWLA